jgi:Mlc titration factor MtfA (ptsG expression regulator)
MLFKWLTSRRRRKLLASAFPDAWLRYMRQNVALYALLSDAEQGKLRDDLRVFISEKNWEGCGGMAVSDEVKVTIAAQACLLLLAIEHDYFGRVRSILVYPSGYRSPSERHVQGGTIEESDEGRLGEAWYRGPVVLAWDSVLAGGRSLDDGRNVVLHEFAHQLDFLDGLADGTPLLENDAQYRTWQKVMTEEYERLCRESAKGHATLLDEYGSTNEAEFFAVATECFFEKPRPMQRRHPLLYDVLRDYYKQDPAKRLEPRKSQN